MLQAPEKSLCAHVVQRTLLTLFWVLDKGTTIPVDSFPYYIRFSSQSTVSDLGSGLDGIWGSVIAAELLALGVTALSFAMKKKRYGYV